jgi:phosphohistidine phosphatase
MLPGSGQTLETHKWSPDIFTSMDLYLLRHGKAEKAAPGGGSDSERPLTLRGTTELKEIASWMCTQGCIIDCIATSPLIRAHETAAIIAETYPAAQGPELWEELAPGGDCDRLLSRIRQQHTTRSLLLIGHEPSMSAFIGRIISVSGEVSIELKKGGLAKIVNFFPSGESSGDLAWLLSPRHMRPVV